MGRIHPVSTYLCLLLLVASAAPAVAGVKGYIWRSKGTVIWSNVGGNKNSVEQNSEPDGNKWIQISPLNETYGGSDRINISVDRNPPPPPLTLQHQVRVNLVVGDVVRKNPPARMADLTRESAQRGRNVHLLSGTTRIDLDTLAFFQGDTLDDGTRFDEPWAAGQTWAFHLDPAEAQWITTGTPSLTTTGDVVATLASVTSSDITIHIDAEPSTTGEDDLFVHGVAIRAGPGVTAVRLFEGFQGRCDLWIDGQLADSTTHDSLRFHLAQVLDIPTVTYPLRPKLDAHVAQVVALITDPTSGVTSDSLLAFGEALDDSSRLQVFIKGSLSGDQLRSYPGVDVRAAIPDSTGVDTIFTASVPLDSALIGAIVSRSDVSRIGAAAVMQPELDQSVPTTNADLLRGGPPNFAKVGTTPGLNGSGIMIGTIDTGVSLSHTDFASPVIAPPPTRIVALWDQGDRGGAPATKPKPYGYGSAWTNGQIDAGQCREQDTNSHGTHVLGIAGANGTQSGGGAITYVGMAPRADLGVVKLRNVNTTTDLVDGADFLCARARERIENLVINISAGTQDGPHDGMSLLDQSLDKLMKEGVVIVKSAGNDQLLNNHAEATAAAAPGSKITFQITNSADWDVVNLMGYYNAPGAVTMALTTPGRPDLGIVPRTFTVGPGTGMSDIGNSRNGVLDLTNTTTRGTEAGMFRIFIHQGQPQAGNQIINGTWQITLTDNSGATPKVDFWYVIGALGNNRPAGPLAVNFVMGNASNRCKISEPGNGRRIITVANFVDRKSWTDCFGRSPAIQGETIENLATSSSNGPTRDGREKPELAAPGTMIGSAASYDGAANPCGGAQPPNPIFNLNDGGNHIMKSGTSMAAPHVTGAVALYMQSLGNGQRVVTPETAKAFLIERADKNVENPARMLAGWEKGWGHGSLNLGDLEPPVVSAIVPDGGKLNTQFVGTKSTIRWTATDGPAPIPAPPGPRRRAPLAPGVDKVDIVLFRNGLNAAPEIVAQNLPNVPSAFEWVVTGPTSANAYMAIVARDQAGNVGTRRSSAAFAILDPLLGLRALQRALVPRGSMFHLAFGFVNHTASGPFSVAIFDSAGVCPPLFTTASVDSADSAAFVFDCVAPSSGDSFEVRFRVFPAGDSVHAQTAATTVVLADPLATPAPQAPSRFALYQNHPNPWGRTTAIAFDLPVPAHVRIEIFDSQGRRVRVLADGSYTAGHRSASWDRRDDSGNRVHAGFYWYRLTAETFRAQRKMLLLP